MNESRIPPILEVGELVFSMAEVKEIARIAAERRESEGARCLGDLTCLARAAANSCGAEPLASPRGGRGASLAAARRRGYRPVRMAEKGYMDQWTCVDCGMECSRPATKGQKPKRCPLCRRKWRDWLPVEVRRFVYERDGWLCQICHDPVDGSLIGSRSQWRPSIDHIIPRAKGGSDEPDNLRLAHLWCNAVLNDGRAYSDGDFRRDPVPA